MRIEKADCLDFMGCMDAGAVDSIATDPPYGLSFMGKEWDHGVPGVHFWEAALRVAKPGSYLLAFGGTRTHHRLMCAIEDGGWEIRDVLMWVYGSGFPKSHNLGGEHKGWGTALKPAWEPIIMARKRPEGTIVQNVHEYGTGAINIDGCRVETTESLNGGAYAKERQVSASEWAKSGSLHKTTGNDFVQPMGRWPANLLHDGSEIVRSTFPNAVGQQGLAKTDGTPHGNNTFSPMKNITTNPEPRSEEDKSAARFFYCAKASKMDRNEGIAPLLNIHPTVKPTELMRYLCRLVTPKGGVVYDPFMGSGSTGKAAILDGFQFIGTDLDEVHVEIAKARCGCAEKQHFARQSELSFV